MQAYETSTSTLKSIMSNPALDMDNVEKTTEALAEVMSNQEEVDNAIRIGGEIAVGASGREGVDDDELKKELEEMVRDEKERQRVEAAEAKLAEREKAKEAPAAPEPALAPVPAPSSVSDQSATLPPAETTPHVETAEERVWRERYEDAQLRKKEEAARADAERSRREARLAAE